MIVVHFVLFFIVFVLSEETAQNQKLTSIIREENNCECGRYDEIGPRIVGGEEAEPHEYPWMIAILNNGKMHCGGSLINDRYVLTAGHCLKWLRKENLSAVLGLHDRVLFETERLGGISVEIEDYLVHENFSSDDFHDVEDIGLIKFKNPVIFTPEIKPVCLPHKTGEDYSKKIAHVIGWGRISSDGEPSRYLKEANVSIITNEECKKVPKIQEHIADSMLCAYQYKTDACQGDSGGPLIYEKVPGKVEQVGIVSWGIGCAEPGIPGVYTRITSYLEWIALHTEDAIYCKNPV